MAVETIDTIGVAITLDTSGFDAGLTKARRDLSAFESTRSRALKAPQTVSITPQFSINQTHARALKIDMNEQLSKMAARNEAVAIPVKLGNSDWAGMRTQIAQHIGEVPIKVTLAGSIGGLRGQAKSIATQGAGSTTDLLRVVEAFIAYSQGTSLTGAATQMRRAAATKGVKTIPGMAHGGPVGPGQIRLVGEEGPEVVEFRQPAQVYRTGTRPPKSNLRRARSASYGSVRPMEIRGWETGDWSHWPNEHVRDTGYVYRGVGPNLNQNVRRGGPMVDHWTGNEPTYRPGMPPSSNRRRIEEVGGEGRVSHWALDSRDASDYGTYIYRTRRTPDFVGPFSHLGRRIPVSSNATQHGDRRFRFGMDDYEYITPSHKPPSALQYWGDDDRWHNFRRGRRREQGGPVIPAYFGERAINDMDRSAASRFGFPILHAEWDAIRHDRIPQGMVRLIRGGRSAKDTDTRPLIAQPGGGVYGRGIYTGDASHHPGRDIARIFARDDWYNPYGNEDEPHALLQTGFFPQKAILDMGTFGLGDSKEEQIFKRLISLYSNMSPRRRPIARDSAQHVRGILHGFASGDKYQSGELLGTIAELREQFDRLMARRGIYAASYNTNSPEPTPKGMPRDTVLIFPGGKDMVVPEAYSVFGSLSDDPPRRSGGGRAFHGPAPRREYQDKSLEEWLDRMDRDAPQSQAERNRLKGKRDWYVDHHGMLIDRLAEKRMAGGPAESKQVNQYSMKPEGGWHEARDVGGMTDAVLRAIEHFQTHTEPGGYVGVAPTRHGGNVVQMHAADGTIESWRLLAKKRMASGGPTFERGVPTSATLARASRMAGGWSGNAMSGKAALMRSFMGADEHVGEEPADRLNHDVMRMTFLVDGEPQEFVGTQPEITQQVLSRSAMGAVVRPWNPRKEQIGPNGNLRSGQFRRMRMFGGPASNGIATYNPKAHFKFKSAAGKTMRPADYFLLPITDREETPEEAAAFARHVEAMKSATPQEIKDGRNWYAINHAIHQMLGMQYGHPTDLMAKVSGTMSPRAAYPNEVLGLEEILKGTSTQQISKMLGLISGNVDRARLVLGGAPLTGRKVTDYVGSTLAAALDPSKQQPEDRFYANDAWQLRVTRGVWDNDKATDEQWWASRLGGLRAAISLSQKYGLTPFQQQAVTWTSARNQWLYGPDGYLGHKANRAFVARESAQVAEWEDLKKRARAAGIVLPKSFGGPAIGGKANEAYVETMARIKALTQDDPWSAGGTFPADAGHSTPNRGWAVGIPDVGRTAAFVRPGRRSAFIRKFEQVRRLAEAQGSPYVGTWFNPASGMIEIDPSAVIDGKRNADLVARAYGQTGIYGLGQRGGYADTSSTPTRMGRRSPRIRDLIGLRRYPEPIEMLPVSLLQQLMTEDRERNPRSGPGATDLNELAMDMREHGVHNPLNILYENQTGRVGISDGNHRLAAAIRLGMKYLPAVVHGVDKGNPRWLKQTIASRKPTTIPGAFDINGPYAPPTYTAPSAVGLHSRTRFAKRSRGGFVLSDLFQQLAGPALSRDVRDVGREIVSQIPLLSTVLDPKRAVGIFDPNDAVHRQWGSGMAEWYFDKDRGYGSILVNPNSLKRAVSVRDEAGFGVPDLNPGGPPFHAPGTEHTRGLVAHELGHAFEDLVHKVYGKRRYQDRTRVAGHSGVPGSPDYREFYPTHLGGAFSAYERVAMSGAPISQYPLDRYDNVADHLAAQNPNRSIYEEEDDHRTARRAAMKEQLAETFAARMVGRPPADWEIARMPASSPGLWPMQGSFKRWEAGDAVARHEALVSAMDDIITQVNTPKWRRDKSGLILPRMFGGPAARGISHTKYLLDLMGADDDRPYLDEFPDNDVPGRVNRDFAGDPIPSTIAARGTGFDSYFRQMARREEGYTRQEAFASAMAGWIRRHKLVSAEEADRLFVGEFDENGMFRRKTGGFDVPEPMPGPRQIGPWARHLKKIRPHATGGAEQGQQTYLVGELAPELFVPNRSLHLVPGDVMDKIPKRAQGGETRKMGGGVIEVGSKGPHLFTPPEDGWIIPHNLVGQVYPNIPRARSGIRSMPKTARFRMPDLDEQSLRDFAEQQAEFSNEILEGNMGGMQAMSGRTPASVLASMAASGIRTDFIRRQHQARTAMSLANQVARQEREPILAGQFARTKALPELDEALKARQAKMADLERTQQERRDRGATGTKIYGETQTRLGKLNTEITAITAAIPKWQKVADEGAEAQKRLNVANENAGKVASRAQPGKLDQASMGLQVFAANAGYGLLMQGVGVLTSALTPAIESVVDSLFGFQAANTRATRVLGTGIVQAGGNVTKAFAEVAQSIGAGADAMEYLKDRLGSSATVKAGQMVEAGGADYWRGAMMPQRGAPEGLYGGYGGLFNTGILAQQMGGAAGFAETIGGNFAAGNLAYGSNAFQISNPGQIPSAEIAGGGPVPAPWEDPGEFMKRLIGASPIGLLTGDPAAQWFPNTVKGLDEAVWPLEGAAGRPGPREDAIVFEAQQGNQKIAETQKEYAAHITDLMQRSTMVEAQPGTAFSLRGGFGRAGEQRTSQQQSDVDKFLKAALETKDQAAIDAAENMVAAGYLMLDASGNIVDSGEEFQKGMEQAAKGATITDPKVYMAQQTRAIMAGYSAQSEQAAYQAGGLKFGNNQTFAGRISAQFGEQLAAQPFIAAGAGISKIGMGKETRSVLADTRKLQNDLTDAGAAAVTEQENWIRSLEKGNPALAGAADQYKSFMGTVIDSGKVIAGYQEQIAGLQLGAAEASFSNNMRLANRAVSDALGLAGRASGPNNLGYVQRQQTMLGFGLQQKQINFQVALAGFQAPGLTSEERAARQAEAKIEARYAQRQLNLSRQAFGIQADRGVTDTTAARRVLKVEWETQQQVAAITRRIAAEQAKQGQALAKAGIQVQRAENVFSGNLGAAAEYVSRFGGTIQAATDALRTALGMEAINWGNKSGPRAAGYFGSVTGATQMTVGEAGTETVAVLRNPRQAFMPTMGGGGGGGGAPATVNLYLTVQGDVKDEATVAKIVRAVEDSFNRKAARLGMRSLVSASG